MIILYKTDPGPIWMALSGFGQMHLVWKKAGDLDGLVRVWPNASGLEESR